MEFHNFESLLISMEMLSRLLLEYAISELKRRAGKGTGPCSFWEMGIP
jgi:hypothetical protein